MQLKIKQILSKNKDIAKSISLNVICKPLSMIVSFLYTPILLSYLGNERFGVWITLLSIVNWILIFDLGIGGGVRNLLSTKIENHDERVIREIVSTAYGFLSLILIGLFALLLAFFFIFDWNKFFNTTIVVKPAVLLVLVFSLMSFVFNLTNSILCSIQRSEYVAIINLIVQVINLLGIILLSIFEHRYINSITPVSLVYVLTAALINLFCLFIIWHKNRVFKPSIRFFNRKYIRAIFSFGFKLFFIQIAGVLLFTTANIIISKLYSPQDVTPYGISRTLFNVIFSVFVAFITPMWSRYTVENEKGNVTWIKKGINYQILLLIPFIIGIVILYLFFDQITAIWLRKEIFFQKGLILSMALYCFFSMYTAIFSTFLNGVGEITLQMIMALIAAVVYIPLSIFLATVCKLGVTGISFGLVICQIPGVIVFPIQTYRILNRKHRNNGLKAGEDLNSSTLTEMSLS